VKRKEEREREMNEEGREEQGRLKRRTYQEKNLATSKVAKEREK
jgi:hypothetical protein